MAKRTSELWLKLIHQQKQSELTVAQFCKHNRLSRSNFYLKRNEFSEAHSCCSILCKAWQCLLSQ